MNKPAHPTTRCRQLVGRYLCLLLILLFFSASGSAASAKELQRTIDSILNAYGGKERLAKIKTISAHGRIDDFLRKTSGGYARTMRRPDELRIDILPEQGGEVRILSHGNGWQGSGDRLTQANPLSLSSMRYQYGYLDLPMSLADGTARVQYQGVKELHDRPMKLLLVELEGAPELRAYVDLTTHQIRRVEATFSMGAMGSSLLGTEYEDFRMVDGALFPFRLINFAGGNRISILTIVRLMVDQPLTKNAFPEYRKN